MENQVIEGQDYSVRLNKAENTVIFAGELSLGLTNRISSY